MSCTHPGESLILDGVVFDVVANRVDYARAVCSEEGCGELLHITKAGTAVPVDGGALDDGGPHCESGIATPSVNV